MLCLKPNWSAPHFLQAFSTPLQDTIDLSLPDTVEWLKQTHSTQCVVVEETAERQADAAITRTLNRALVIRTADCLPILLFSASHQEIAAIHAGWRGLAQGVIESTLSQLKSLPNALTVWIGPAICGQCYEVGGDVCDIFLSRYPFAKDAIVPHQEKCNSPARHPESRRDEGSPEKWRLDLKKVATLLFNQLGVTQVFQSPVCTFEEKSLFSYRRDGQTGRIGTFIWMTET